jgi:hypothetical protein
MPAKFYRVAAALKPGALAICLFCNAVSAPHANLTPTFDHLVPVTSPGFVYRAPIVFLTFGTVVSDETSP